MSLPEIREAGPARGGRDIRRAARGRRRGTGQPDLAARGRLPGVLDWLWAQACPVLASGAAAGARDRIAARVTVPAPARLAVPEGVATLVETYNRGNLTNLAVLTAVRLRAAGQAPGTPGAAAAVGAMLPPPPPLPRLGDLAPALAAVVRSLAARHALSDASVVPSLYLHLSHWPGVLAGLPGLLASLPMNDGRDRAVAAAEAEAPGLIAGLGAAPDAPGRSTPSWRPCACSRAR